MFESKFLKENKDAWLISKAHLHLVTDQLNIGFFEMDVKSGEIRCTAACKTNFGICPDATFSYTQLLSIILPEDLEAMQDEVHLALSGEKENYQAIYRIRKADGEVRWIKADGTVQRDGDTIISFVGTSQDITDFKI